jgi:predicted RNA-binding protein YlxR (DUF448 family)
MPTRTCVGCRKTDEQNLLKRLALEANGSIRIDKTRTCSGRGAYLHPQRACFEEALHNGGLPKAFRRKVQPIDTERLWEALVEEDKELGHEQR